MKGYEFIKVLGNVCVVGYFVCVYKEVDGNKVRIQVEDFLGRIEGYDVREFFDMNGLMLWVCRDIGTEVEEAAQVARILDQLRKAA